MSARQTLLTQRFKLCFPIAAGALTAGAGIRVRLVGVAGLALLGALWGCADSRAAEQPAATPPPVAVVAATLHAQTVPITADFVATTAAMQAVDIHARVTGTLDTVAFKEGSMVTKGQLLFKIQPEKYESAVQAAQASLLKSQADLRKAQDLQPVAQAQAAVDASKADLDRANLTVARLRPLAAAKAVPQKDLDNALSSQAAARANLEGALAGLNNAKVDQSVGIAQSNAAILTAQSQLSDAKLNLSYTTIRSPVTGLIGFLTVDQGNVVGTAGDQILDTVSTIDPMKVTFSVDELTYLSLAGAKHDATTRSLRSQPLQLVLANNSIYGQTGSLYAVNRVLNDKTGTIAVIATFPNPDGQLRPGQFARIRLTTQVRRNAVLIPQTAVVRTQGTTAAYVIAADDKVQLRSITLGPQHDEFFVVADGLTAGERVISEGTLKVQPGTTVVVKNAGSSK